MTQLTFSVSGKPAPKGSLRSVGQGRMVEQVKGSHPWRLLVAAAAREARDRTSWECLLGPVIVAVDIVTPRPKSVTRDYPIKRSAGDVDKLARNVLDALVDALIMKDDSQVIDLHIYKRYPTDRDQGAYVTVSSYPQAATTFAQGRG